CGHKFNTSLQFIHLAFWPFSSYYSKDRKQALTSQVPDRACSLWCKTSAGCLAPWYRFPNRGHAWRNRSLARGSLPLSARSSLRVRSFLSPRSFIVVGLCFHCPARYALADLSGKVRRL